ncbi:hypothetical protein GCM10010193_13240 [Kitasatospora atroaurantiaca]
MRGTLVGRTEALDKVKALRLLPDGVHVTTRMVADYFGVHEEAVNSVVRRHREELRESGMALLKGADLQDFLVVNMTTRKSPGRGLTVFPRRAVLNVAMLLRDSEVARQVRAHLLDLAERPAESAGRWPEAMVAEIAERAALAVRDELRELREANAALVRQLELERELIASMSVRVADTGCAVRSMGGRVDMLCSMLASPGPGRRRRTRRRP